MICIQLEKGNPEEQIRESFHFDNEFEVGFDFYVEFAIENNLIVKNEQTGKYKITNNGKEFINAILKEN
jgi:hypothetical protein